MRTYFSILLALPLLVSGRPYVYRGAHVSHDPLPHDNSAIPIYSGNPVGVESTDKPTPAPAIPTTATPTTAAPTTAAP